MKTAADIEREAAEWVVRIGDPACSAEQLAALDTWLALNPEHERVFQELQDDWNELDESESAPPSNRDNSNLAEADVTGPGSLELADEAIEVALACKGVIRAYHQRYASDPNDVERLVAQTYRPLVAMSTSELARVRSIPEFLLATARKLAQSQLRQRSVIPMETLNDMERLETLDVDAQIQAIANTDRNLSALTEAFDSLPRRCRVVFILYKIHGYSCEQICARLDISQRAVTKRLEEAARHFEEVLHRSK